MRDLVLTVKDGKFTQRVLQSAARPGARRVFANTAWLFAERAVRLGVGVVVTALVARYLGPDRFGLLSYAIAFASLFGAIATLGLDEIVIRDIVRSPGASAEILGTTFVLKLAASIVTVALAVGGIALVRPGDTGYLALVAVVSAGTVFTAFNAIDLWFQSQVLSKHVVLARNTSYLLTAGARLTLVWVSAPVIAFAALLSGELLLTAISLSFAYHITGKSFRCWHVTIRRGRTLLAQSWPLMLSGIAILIYMRIDVIMLGQMTSETEVGIYGAATRLSEIWYVVPLAIVSSVFPAIVRSREADRLLYNRRLLRLLSLMSMLAIGVALPLTFLSGWLVAIVFGPSFHAAAPVLAIHIWAALFVFWGVAQQPWFVNEGLMRLSLTRTACGAVVNVVLNLFLIPAYGSIGAAISTVIAYAVAVVLLNAFDSRTRDIFVLQLKSLFPRSLFGRA
jgi:PST family polysaccharide transporter